VERESCEKEGVGFRVCPEHKQSTRRTLSATLAFEMRSKRHHVEVLHLGAMHAAVMLPCFTFILPCINFHSFAFILLRSSDKSV
jgi:hypothetical protein